LIFRRRVGHSILQHTLHSLLQSAATFDKVLAFFFMCANAAGLSMSSAGLRRLAIFWRLIILGAEVQFPIASTSKQLESHTQSFLYSFPASMALC
jgi:hypothetical protein